MVSVKGRFPASLGIVVKNEARWLAQCLEGIRHWVREILVLDTGSTDATPRVARRLGARVLCERWTAEDQVRNRIWRLATQPWILLLDADERIAAKDLPRLGKLFSAPGAIAYEFVRRDYTDGENLLWDWRPNQGEYPREEGFSQRCGWIPRKVIRLVRRQAGARYRGLCHPALEFPSEAHDRIRPAPFPIHHFASRKGAGFVRKKRRRYLRFLLREVRSGVRRPKLALQAALELFAAGKDGLAFHYARRALREDGTGADPSKLLAMIALEKGRHRQALQVLRRALPRHPRSSDLWCLSGITRFLLGDLPSAQRALANALRISAHHPLAWNAWGALWEEQGDLPRARRAYETALRWHPGLREAKRSLERISRHG